MPKKYLEFVIPNSTLQEVASRRYPRGTEKPYYERYMWQSEPIQRPRRPPTPIQILGEQYEVWDNTLRMTEGWLVPVEAKDEYSFCVRLTHRSPGRLPTLLKRWEDKAHAYSLLGPNYLDPDEGEEFWTYENGSFCGPRLIAVKEIGLRPRLAPIDEGVDMFAGLQWVRFTELGDEPNEPNVEEEGTRSGTGWVSIPEDLMKKLLYGKRTRSSTLPAISEERQARLSYLYGLRAQWWRRQGDSDYNLLVAELPCCTVRDSVQRQGLCIYHRNHETPWEEMMHQPVAKIVQAGGITISPRPNWLQDSHILFTSFVRRVEF